LIQDHIDHCLEDATGRGGREANAALTEFKALTKYL
jgi:DNA-binding FrmR family transcriptional regulator